MRTRAAHRTHHGPIGLRILANQLPPLPFLLAGASLLRGQPDGLYWILPGTLSSFAAGIFSAWVLLIEIQR